MAMTALQKNRSVRREAMREQLSADGHYQQLTAALEKLAELAEGNIDQDSKDRFTMYSVIADRRWRIVSKYPTPVEEPERQGVDRVVVVGVISHEQALESHGV